MFIFLIKGKLDYIGIHSCYLLIKSAQNNSKFLVNILGISKVTKVLGMIKTFEKVTKFKFNYIFTGKIILVSTYFLAFNNFVKRFLNLILPYLLNEI